MLTGQSDVGVAVFNEKIFVTGGYSWNNRCMVDIVQCYNPVENKWTKTFTLPAALGGVRACTLTVLPRLIYSHQSSREEESSSRNSSVLQQHASGDGSINPADEDDEDEMMAVDFVRVSRPHIINGLL